MKLQLTDNDPEKLPNTSKPVNENEEFCGIFSYKFGEYNLLYAGEIDGVISNQKLTEQSILESGVKFAELKTHSKNRNSFFYFKLARCWCQSFLSCVDKVLFGFRTRNGTVTKVKEYTLNQLLEMTTGLRSWHINKAKNFCHEFLKFVKNTVQEDHDKCVYKFSWDPKNQITIKTEELRNLNDSKYSFLRNWYVAAESNRTQINSQDTLELRRNQGRFLYNNSREKQPLRVRHKYRTTFTSFEPYHRNEFRFSRGRGNRQWNKNYVSRRYHNTSAERGKNWNERNQMF